MLKLLRRLFTGEKDTIPFSIKNQVATDDQSFPPVTGEIVLTGQGIEIKFNGYETVYEDNLGSLIYIEVTDGRLQLHYWNNRRREDCQTINFEGAKTPRRVPSVWKRAE